MKKLKFLLTLTSVAILTLLMMTATCTWACAMTSSMDITVVSVNKVAAAGFVDISSAMLQQITAQNQIVGLNNTSNLWTSYQNQSNQIENQLNEMATLSGQIGPPAMNNANMTQSNYAFTLPNPFNAQNNPFNGLNSGYDQDG